MDWENEHGDDGSVCGPMCYFDIVKTLMKAIPLGPPFRRTDNDKA